MNIAILGASGFLGTLFSDYFISENHSVIYISRNLLDDFSGLIDKLKTVDVLLNFAGADISKRWTKKYKNEIYTSRIESTRKLVNCLNAISNKNIQFINASAIGIYSDLGMHVDTSSSYGNSFLSKVVIDWEREVGKVYNQNITTCIIRLGIVMDRRGGYLLKVLVANEVRISPYFGSKLYPLGFIDSYDLLKSISFIIDQKVIGVVNVSAPNSTSNYQIAKLLSKFNKTSLVFCIPNFILKAIFGSRYFIFNGTPVAFPKRLIDLGFQFKYDTIEKSLKSKIHYVESD